jgi:hypothetical protein
MQGYCFARNDKAESFTNDALSLRGRSPKQPTSTLDLQKLMYFSRVDLR